MTFMQIPPVPGDYLARVTMLEEAVTPTKSVPYIRGRLEFMEGPDKGGTMITTWGKFGWEAMMQAAGVLPEDRYAFEKIQGYWLVRVVKGMTNTFKHYAQIELRIKE